MNVFILDKTPEKSAQFQCDKHVVKMIVESAQMLSTAHRMLDGVEMRVQSVSGKRLVKYWRLNDNREHKLYKTAHTGHPCTVWTAKTDSNYLWHYRHFAALCDEYTYRYGKVHKTDSMLRTLLSNTPNNIRNGELTKQPLAMKSNPECMFSCVVESYRAFYKTKQTKFSMVWSKRDVPEWFQS